MEHGIQNPTNDWNPESKVPMTENPESGTWNPESTVWNPESKTVLDSPYIWDLDHHTFLGNCPPTPPLSQH